MSRVWLRMAGTSEATKYSLSPMPITTGGPERAATILFGSVRAITASANTPASSLTAARTASSRLPLKCASTRCAITSVSVSVLNYVAFGLEALLQRQVVLDDPVVHHHHVARAIAVRVGVLLGGPPMRGPAGMPDAESALDRVQPDGLFQIAQFALGAPDLECCRRNRPPGRPSRIPGIRGASGPRG